MAIKKTMVLPLVFLFFARSGYTQGCVAIRNIAGFGQFAELGFDQNKGKEKWLMDVNKNEDNNR